MKISSTNLPAALLATPFGWICPNNFDTSREMSTKKHIQQSETSVDVTIEYVHTGITSYESYIFLAVQK